MSITPSRHLLAISLASILSAAAPAMAQQVIADGGVPGEDLKQPPEGDYTTGGPGEFVFHARNGGAIVPLAQTHLSTSGDGAAAVRVENYGFVTLQPGSSILTTGTTSAGVSVTAADFSAFGTRIETRGAASVGVEADGNSGVDLVDSAVRTTGAASHGLVGEGQAYLFLRNSHVRADGNGAWAAILSDNSRLQIHGGSLVSQQHGGVWVRGASIPGLTLADGAVLYGGNGVALQLDAAVAGRFDVALENNALMVGDIVINPDDLAGGLVPQSDVYVQLGSGAVWNGTSDRVRALSMEAGSRWMLTGDAHIGTLSVTGGELALSDPLLGGFNTLTVEGDLHSEAASFIFRGALGGDDSAMDRLHVRGDSSGDAMVVVQNIGGLGAQTLEGITLIQVDGASAANYALAGRAVAGSYDYFLHKGGIAGGEGNWYLRSQLPTVPDPCEVDPSQPGCVPVDPTDPVDPVDPINPILPPPVLRPEAGAYLANQSAAINMFSHRLNDRIGAVSLDEGRAAWARVGRQQADFSAVGGQLSIDGNTSVLQIGSELVRRGNAAFGVMLGTGRADSSAVSDLTGYSAKGRVRGSAVGVYGTWLQAADGTQGAYVDANLQHGRFDNRVQGIGLAPEHYDSRMASVSLETGYTFNVWQGAASALYVQPQLQLSHVDFRADRHVESNGTVIDHADAGGLSGRLGVRVFGHGIAADNAVQPYLGVNWLRGSGASTLQFNGDTLGADVPRNRYEVQAGAELKLGQRWGAWGGLTVQRGDRGYRNVGGQLGLRKAW
ncbi:autotransporter outer membrane beta-barrel domain-containing protein [Stenotrophomonas hibiscicola]|uniref:autotransporter family protein n=1 Tax=Stenotrophomonas hibiscicola TaxID=86189 RepID=UPI003209D250